MQIVEVFLIFFRFTFNKRRAFLLQILYSTILVLKCRKHFFLRNLQTTALSTD